MVRAKARVSQKACRNVEVTVSRVNGTAWSAYSTAHPSTEHAVHSTAHSRHCCREESEGQRVRESERQGVRGHCVLLPAAVTVTMRERCVQVCNHACHMVQLLVLHTHAPCKLSWALLGTPPLPLPAPTHTTHCSVVLRNYNVIVACLSSGKVLGSVHVPMYSRYRHTTPQMRAPFFPRHPLPNACACRGVHVLGATGYTPTHPPPTYSMPAFSQLPILSLSHAVQLLVLHMHGPESRDGRYCVHPHAPPLHTQPLGMPPFFSTPHPLPFPCCTAAILHMHGPEGRDGRCSVHPQRPPPTHNPLACLISSQTTTLSLSHAVQLLVLHMHGPEGGAGR